MERPSHCDYLFESGVEYVYITRDVDYNELMDIIAVVENIIAENGGYDCIILLTQVFTIFTFHPVGTRLASASNICVSGFMKCSRRKVSRLMGRV